METRRDKRATMDQFRVKRDGEGKIIPQEMSTAMGAVMVLPMTYGDAEVMAARSKGEDGLNADAVAQYFGKHIIDPCFSDIQDYGPIDGDFVQNELKALAVKELLAAVMDASGLKDEVDIEVDEDGTAKVSLKNE